MFTNQIIRTLIFLSMVPLIFTAHGSQTTPTSASSSVDFDKFPRAGRDAFWMKNPQNPSQKILLVPSAHMLSLRFVKPEILAAMKACDVLIIESLEGGARSWEDVDLMREAFSNIPSLENLEKLGVLRKENEGFFEGDDNLSWINLSDLNQASKDFLRQNIEPVLRRPVELLHPLAVLMLVRNASDSKVKHMTIDAQIANFFDLGNRPVFGLESKQEVLGEQEEEKWGEVFNAQLFSLGRKAIPTIISSINSFVSKIKTTNKNVPNKSQQSAGQILDEIERRFKASPTDAIRGFIGRNEKWISSEKGRLLWYLTNYPDKSFVIVVGAGHFPGDKGIVKLLSDKGFSFSYFEDGQLLISKDVVAEISETEVVLNKLIEEGKLLEIKEPAADMKAEFIPVIEETKKNTLSRLEKYMPQGVPEAQRMNTYRAMVNFYITNRNKLHDDPDVGDKEKAMRILKENPLLSFDALKSKIIQ